MDTRRTSKTLTEVFTLVFFAPRRVSLARSEKASFWAAPFLTLVFCGQFIHLNNFFGLGLHRDLLGGDLRYLALLGLNPIFATDIYTKPSSSSQLESGAVGRNLSRSLFSWYFTRLVRA